MSPLSDIPAEIANQILALVPASDLLNLCLTKKSLRDAAEPFLYSTIILEWDYNHIPAIIPLLRTLLQRPQLLDCIHTVSMNGCSFNGGYTPTLDLNSADISFEQCINAIKKTNVPYTDVWIKKLKSGNTCLEALSALFLAILSKVQRLALSQNFINSREIIGKVIQSKILGGSELSTFKQLKDVRYIKRGDHRTMKNNQIFPGVISLFYLPTVENIAAWIPNPPVFRWPAAEPNLNYLTSLDILRLSEDNLARILKLTRNLKSLLWTWIFDETDDPGNTMKLNFETVIKALSPIKGTLEKLQIRLEMGPIISPVFKPEIIITGSLVGLAGFSQLVYLEVPFVSLTGFGDTPLPIEDSVPTSVEILALSDDMLLDDAVKWQQPYFERYQTGYAPAGAIDDHIEALCDNIPTQLPLLRDLIFFADNDFEPIFELVNFDSTIDIYADDDFNIRVSTRELSLSRYSFGWREIPEVDYDKKTSGPRWAK